MSSALAQLANDYAAAYKADMASFRTKDQADKICAIAERVAQSCSDLQTGAKSVASAKSDIRGALVVGEAIANKLAKEDDAWIARQATISQADWQRKARQQQAEDQKLLTNLGALTSQLGKGSEADPVYDQLVDGFEDMLASENELIA
ncbi:MULTISPECIES: hypothetical protein [unclassified Thalassospira]|uniref:hypothetical protein n=1 Tax=unclassified Thalassospira TaxID=2648997 RepID=UPI000EECEF4D|nr:MULTISPECIES: hypothetical protein [unclassified Thalassospira]HAI32346.1 hypothetical protein [Thalassospira sp.]